VTFHGAHFIITHKMQASALHTSRAALVLRPLSSLPRRGGTASDAASRRLGFNPARAPVRAVAAAASAASSTSTSTSTSAQAPHSLSIADLARPVLPSHGAAPSATTSTTANPTYQVAVAAAAAPPTPTPTLLECAVPVALAMSAGLACALAFTSAKKNLDTPGRPWLDDTTVGRERDRRFRVYKEASRSILAPVK